MIPIIINNYNRLTWVKTMLEQIARIPNCYPIISDNCSTYEPLLDWYAEKPCEIIVQPSNLGHQGPWLSGLVAERGKSGYVVTDPDLDISGVPDNVLEIMQEGLNRYSHVIKAGLSLEIDDLPENDMTVEVIKWERQFWRCAHDGKQFYFAALDTTFALYRGNYLVLDDRTKQIFLQGLRAYRPYTARHLPWYNHMQDGQIVNAAIPLPSEEEVYYRSQCKTASHWALHPLT